MVKKRKGRVLIDSDTEDSGSEENLDQVSGDGALGPAEPRPGLARAGSPGAEEAPGRPAAPLGRAEGQRRGLLGDQRGGGGGEAERGGRAVRLGSGAAAWEAAAAEARRRRSRERRSCCPPPETAVGVWMYGGGEPWQVEKERPGWLLPAGWAGGLLEAPPGQALVELWAYWRWLVLGSSWQLNCGNRGANG